MAKKTTLTVTFPDGTTGKRVTEHAYTHVVAVQRYGEWIAPHWSRSEAGAQKMAYNGTVIVKVNNPIEVNPAIEATAAPAPIAESQEDKWTKSHATQPTDWLESLLQFNKAQANQAEMRVRFIAWLEAEIARRATPEDAVNLTGKATRVFQDICMLTEIEPSGDGFVRRPAYMGGSLDELNALGLIDLSQSRFVRLTEYGFKFARQRDWLSPHPDDTIGMLKRAE